MKRSKSADLNQLHGESIDNLPLYSPAANQMSQPEINFTSAANYFNDATSQYESK